MKGTSKHLSADRPLQRLRGCFLGDNAAVPPAYWVKVEKCASSVDILDVCKFTTFCDRKGYIRKWKQSEIPVTVIALALERQSFIWDQFKYAIKQKYESAERQVYFFLQTIKQHSLIFRFCICIFGPYVTAVIF